MPNSSNINTDTLPNHVAIIMDGNGRWAKQQSKARVFGHKIGVKAVRDTVEGAAEIGIKFLTLYAFPLKIGIDQGQKLMPLWNY